MCYPVSYVAIQIQECSLGINSYDGCMCDTVEQVFSASTTTASSTVTAQQLREGENQLEFG